MLQQVPAERSGHVGCIVLALRTFSFHNHAPKRLFSFGFSVPPVSGARGTRMEVDTLQLVQRLSLLGHCVRVSYLLVSFRLQGL